MRGYTHTFNFMPLKGWESDADSFRLHALEPLEVDMVDCFVPYLYVRDGFMAFRKHNRFHLVRVEDEHLAFSSTTRHDSAFLYNEVEASYVIEANLHALVHDIADEDQILLYCWKMQDVLDVGLIAFFPKWDIANMLNGVNCVISVSA